MKLPDTSPLKIACPKCGTKTEQTIGRIKADGQFTCACGVVVRVGTEQLARDLAEAERMLRDTFKKS